jgi:hypothetical protein
VETEDVEGNLLSNSVEQGGHETMALGDGHGGRAPVLGEKHGEKRESGQGRKKGRRGGGSWRPGASSGGSSVARGSRRWHNHVQEASTQVLPGDSRRRQLFFAKSPLALRSFLGREQTAQNWYKNYILCLFNF